LIRTLNPSSIHDECEQFDQQVIKCLEKIVYDSVVESESQLNQTAIMIAQLPIRLGGLGLFSQLTLAPYASACSLIMSSKVLNDKGFQVDDQLIMRFSRAIKMCIFNSNNQELSPSIKAVMQNQNIPVTSSILNQLTYSTSSNPSTDTQVPTTTNTTSSSVTQPSTLSSSLVASSKDCVINQKNSTDLIHEVAWLNIFKSLDSQTQHRFLDNGGRFGRAWIFALPTSQSTTLSDAQVRYGLRTILLDQFAETISPGNICRCSRPDHPMHHLGCPSTNGLRTRRHNAIVDALKDGLDGMGVKSKKEVQINTRLVADLLINMDQGKWKAVDVAVVSTHLSTSLSAQPDLPDESTWPPHLRVNTNEENEVDVSSSSTTTPTTFSVGGDGVETSNSNPQAIHPMTQIVSYRHGCWEGSVGLAISSTEHMKRNHYKSINPNTTTLSQFILTSGGSCGGEANSLWKYISNQSKICDNGKSKMRYLCSRVGVILLRFNSSIAEAKAG
jgi:hypothetical protein